MRWMLLVAAGTVAYGCGQEPVVSKTPPAPATVPAVAPRDTPREQPRKVERVGSIDYTAYGIPIFPGAKVNTDVTLAYQADKRHPRQLSVTMDATGSVREIAEWYRDEIKATTAYASVDLGTLEGTTDMGYPIKVSIAKVDLKSVIILTIDDNPKK